MPAILAFLPFRSATEALLARSRWPIMTVFVLFTLCLIYRFAPCRAHGQWTRIAIGAAVAAIIWVLGSAGFSLYVSDIGSYDRIYGSLGAVVCCCNLVLMSAPWRSLSVRRSMRS